MGDAQDEVRARHLEAPARLVEQFLLGDMSIPLLDGAVALYALGAHFVPVSHRVEKAVVVLGQETRSA